MSKNKSKEKKNTIIMGIIGIIFGLITLPLYYFATINNESRNFWIIVGYVIVYHIIFRILLILIQHILIKFKILEYSPDDLKSYANIYGDDVKHREKINAQYKRQLDRYRAYISGIVSMFISCIIEILVFSEEGIVSAIILSIMIAFPLVFFIHEPPMDDGKGSYNSRTSYSSKPAETSEKEKKAGLTTKTAYITDQFGNITGRADTVSYEGKYGSWETTEYKDNFGNVKGKIDKYK
jgi:hypothetical protein